MPWRIQEIPVTHSRASAMRHDHRHAFSLACRDICSVGLNALSDRGGTIVSSASVVIPRGAVAGSDVKEAPVDRCAMGSRHGSPGGMPDCPGASAKRVRSAALDPPHHQRFLFGSPRGLNICVDAPTWKAVAVLGGNHRTEEHGAVSDVTFPRCPPHHLWCIDAVEASGAASFD